MDYKNQPFSLFTQTHSISDSTDYTNMEEEKADSAVFELLQLFNSSFTDTEFNEFLTKLNEMLLHENRIIQTKSFFELFQTQNINEYLIEYVFCERKITFPIHNSNLALIFKLLLSLMNSQYFIKYYSGCGFIISFIQNIQPFNINVSYDGLCVINRIFSFLDKNKIMEIITPEIFNYLGSIIPTEIEFVNLITSFSCLFCSLTSKIDVLEIDLINSILMKLLVVFDAEQSELYFHSISKILLVLLERGFDVRQFKTQYFKKLNRCYNFGGIDGKITIFCIYEIIIDQSNSKFSYFVFNQHSAQLFDDLIEVPKRRESILKLILTFIKKDSSHIDIILNSHLLDIVLRIQDDLPFSCIELVSQIIDILVNNNYSDQPNIIKIVLKMISFDQDGIIRHVFDLMHAICSFMDKRGRLNEIKEEFCACDGFDILNDLAVEYQEAHNILQAFGLIE